MARTKSVLGAGARLSDYLSASLLARVYPPDLVHQALNEHPHPMPPWFVPSLAPQ